MKKALPYVIVVGAAIVALYAVYHFRTTRLLPQQLEEMQQSQQRLNEVESAEQQDAGYVQEDAESPPPPPSNVTEIPKESMPEEAPDEFNVAFACSNGTFVVTCHRDWAPNGVARFYELVKIGFYNDIRAFRMLPGFVVQFGISGNPTLNNQWMESKIPDDPVKQSNTRGRLTFAASGQPNSRSTQVFVNLGSTEQNTRLDGMGFAPIGEVVQGMDVVDGLYSGYGGEPSNFQAQIADMGNEFLDQRYPNLSKIYRAYFVEIIGAPAGSEPAASDPVDAAPDASANPEPSSGE